MVANQDQMVTILISMLPERVAEQMMLKYEVGVTHLDDIEEKLREHLDKAIDSRQRRGDVERGGRRLGQMKVQGEEDEAKEKEERWQLGWDQEQGREFWIRTAGKRQRTDDNEEEEEAKGGKGQEAGGAQGPAYPG